MKTFAAAAAGILLTLLTGACAPPPPSSDTVSTAQGKVRGVVQDRTRSFTGIPYAQPPTDERRWKPPQPLAPGQGVFDATRPARACPQLASDTAGLDSTDEDCLQLNVTTMSQDGKARPVLVWLHGGGGTNGAGGIFDPRRMVQENDVVVVTVNYRLGIFGNFGFPGLPDGGTFGLQDQQAALRWVKDNVAAFGGDPGQVMLFGESYGALSTTAQLVSPKSRGLFQRAGLQSDLALHNYPAGTIAPEAPALPSIWAAQPEVEALGAAVAEQSGCKDIACLRRLPVTDLLPSGPMFTRFAYGNSVLPEDPVQALREGRFAKVPVISGGTRDEHRLYTAAFYELAGRPVTAKKYRQLLRVAFGKRADAVAAAYAGPKPALAWSSVVTDRVWAQALHEQNQLLARHTRVWAYEFADPDAPAVIPFPDDFPPGAHHSSEVFYQFDETGSESRLSRPQKELASQMNRYWTSFARTGDPNAPGLPVWEPYRTVLALAPDQIAATNYPAEHKLDFWRAP